MDWSWFNTPLREVGEVADWGWFTTPLGLAVIAPAGAFLGALLGVGMTSWTTRATHREKLEADQRLAERKVEADIELSRAKFDYDREQTIFKRRFEIAEQMLGNIYQLRSLMLYVRNGIAFNDEGSSREPEADESEAIKRARDSYYVPQVRLQVENKFLSEMFARRTSCHALFGADAAKVFDLAHQAVHETRVASQLLVEWTNDYGDVDKDTMKQLRNGIWQGMAKHYNQDDIGNKIEEAVCICERLCQPVLGSVSSA